MENPAGNVATGVYDHLLAEPSVAAKADVLYDRREMATRA